MLVVIETHPIQYHAPVWRQVQQAHGIPVTAIYGSDFSVAGALDPEFKVRVAWDVDLLSGYQSVFLSRVGEGGAQQVSAVRPSGLAAVLRRLSPAAVLLTGYSPFFHQAAALAGLACGCPLLFRGEANDQAGSRSMLKAYLRSVLLRFHYRTIDAFLYVGRRAKEHYLNHGCPDDRLFFSPYAVSADPHLPYLHEGSAAERLRTRAELGVPEGSSVLLYSGKLYEAKGCSVLLEALRALPEDVRKRVFMVFVGDGELRLTLEKAAQAILPSQVHFAGFQNQSSLGRYLLAADLFVLPSFSETWGLVVNEAMLYGRPCVVTNRVGCGPDLVDPGLTGEICEARSAPSLAAALRRGLQLAERVGVAAACKRKVAEYSIEAAARGTAAAYQFVQKTKNT